MLFQNSKQLSRFFFHMMVILCKAFIVVHNAFMVTNLYCSYKDSFVHKCLHPMKNYASIVRPKLILATFFLNFFFRLMVFIPKVHCSLLYAARSNTKSNIQIRYKLAPFCIPLLTALYFHSKE